MMSYMHCSVVSIGDLKHYRPAVNEFRYAFLIMSACFLKHYRSAVNEFRYAFSMLRVIIHDVMFYYVRNDPLNWAYRAWRRNHSLEEVFYECNLCLRCDLKPKFVICPRNGKGLL